MSKNQTNSKKPTGPTQLGQDSVLELRGADALVFLQGQLSQDIALIPMGQASIASLNNPKGRLIAVVFVYHASEQNYWLIMPNSMIDTVTTHLSKYVLRSKVNIINREDLYLYGYLNSDDIRSAHSFKLFDFCELAIAIEEKSITDINPSSESQWIEQKIRNGIPDIFPATSERYVAQMLNLDMLNGISFSKGCYTGQEIIARMQHLGRIKRRMLLLESKIDHKPGSIIEIAAQNIGEVVNVVQLNGKRLLLAVMKLDALSKIDPDTMQNQYTQLELPYKI